MEEYEVEEILLDYLKTLSIPDQKEIHSGQDILAALTNDALEDIKEEIWNRIQNSINYISIAQRLQDDLRINLPDSEDEPEEEESDSCCEHEKDE